MSSVRRITFALVAVVAVSAALLVLRPAAAAPGDLDPSFGAGGTVETQISTDAFVSGLAIQADGKIVAGGIAYPGGVVALARYEPNGQLDSAFGSGGIVTGPVVHVRALALQPDGKILLAGSSSDSSSRRGFFSVIRYRPDGSPDATFGSDGLVRGPDGGASSLALQTDGRIVVAGTEPEDYAFKLVRLNADGTLDSSFGSSGSVRTLLGYSAAASAVVIQPDGRILAAGASVPGNPPPPPPPPPAPPPPPPPGPPPLPWRMTLARYNADGSLDPSFGSSGVVTTRLGPGAQISAPAASLALQPDGNIVAAAVNSGRLAMARYRSDGVLDPAFGSSGIVRTQLRSSGSPNGLALQADGMIVLAGSEDGVARYRSHGLPDTAFGSNGVAVPGFPSNGLVDAVALQQDGRIVTSGTRTVERHSRFTLSRYLSKSPTTIAAAPGVVGYGRAAVIRGTLSGRQAGTKVQILKRGCYDFATRAARTTRTGPGGRWHARIRPDSRTTFTAKVEGEMSTELTVGVRPKLTLTKLSDNRYQARLLAARSLAGNLAFLQRFTRGKWANVRRIPLRRIVKRGSGVLSGSTFRARRIAGQRVRLAFPQFGNDACYAAAASRPITG